jgi:hypothetical protein
MLLAVLTIAWRTRGNLRDIVRECPSAATVAPIALVVLYGGVFVSWVWP